MGAYRGGTLLNLGIHDREAPAPQYRGLCFALAADSKDQTYRRLYRNSVNAPCGTARSWRCSKLREIVSNGSRRDSVSGRRPVNVKPEVHPFPRFGGFTQLLSDVDAGDLMFV